MVIITLFLKSDFDWSVVSPFPEICKLHDTSKVSIKIRKLNISKYNWGGCGVWVQKTSVLHTSSKICIHSFIIFHGNVTLAVVRSTRYIFSFFSARALIFCYCIDSHKMWNECLSRRCEQCVCHVCHDVCNKHVIKLWTRKLYHNNSVTLCRNHFNATFVFYIFVLYFVFKFAMQFVL